MKFICEKNVLQKEISFAQEIISSKSTLSVVSNVFLDAREGSLQIRATDIKIGFDTRIPVNVVEAGNCTVFCEKLSAILANIPDGMIEIEQTENKVIIKPSFKKARFSLKTIGSDQFPQLPDIDDDKYFALPLSDFKEMISQVIFAVSDDETRYFMNGVFLERNQDGLIMVATDGRRLAYIKKDLVEGIPEFKGIIIPPKLLNLILRRAGNEGQIKLAVTDKNLFVKFGLYQLSSVLIEGQFPNYQKVIPESHEYKSVLSRSDVIDALKRVSLFVEQKSRRIFFELSEGKLVISSEETELGAAKEEIECDYSGPNSVIAINYKYIEEPLRVIDTEDYTLSFTDTNRAITLTPVPEASYFHILMPMQVD
ncbi:DNA polymerase III subunit beta [Spirochaetota bacterium]